VQRKNNAVLIAAAAFGALIVAGFAGVSYTDEPVHQPNDRANHHPKHESVLEGEAVTTRLGNDATTEQMALRIRRVGDRIQMNRVADPAM
jgi:hypothetical protein